MNVQLTPDQQAFAQQAVQAGRLHHEEEAVQEALTLWESRERTRAELLAAIDAAQTSVNDGLGRIVTEQSMAELAVAISLRGRVRLAAEQASSR